MVTILPIDVDEDIVREGIQCEVARRINAALNELRELANLLEGGSLIRRGEMEKAMQELTKRYETALPLLEYAGSFFDPDESEDAEA